MNRQSEIIQVFAVHTNDTELSNGTPEEFFTKESDAQTAAHKNGYYGQNSPISKQYLIKFKDNYYLLANTKPIDLNGTITKHQNKIKEEALKKLTKQEKIALGLEIDTTTPTPTN